jgi:hypothetical protein
MKRFAQIVSIFFGFPWLSVVLWLLVFRTGLIQQQIAFFSIVLPILNIIIPFLYFFWALRKGIIADIDITKRQQRYGVMTLMLVLQLISLWLIYTRGNATLLDLSLIIDAVFISTYLITLLWKISLHMTINVIGILLVNVLFDWKYMYLLAIIPLVMWSRFYLKKHTLSQLIAGTLVSGSIMLIGFEYFNFV